MDIAWLRKHPPTKAKPLDQHLEEISQLVDEASSTVRRISLSLRPKILDEFGLSAALEWLVKETSRHRRINCQWLKPPMDIQLDEHRRTVMFRVCQEALTNIARHANATEVTLSLQQQDSHIVLEIIDNGCGIHPQYLAYNHTSYGIDGMRERVLQFHGDSSWKTGQRVGHEYGHPYPWHDEVSIDNQ